jgi:hypothetical protein
LQTLRKPDRWTIVALPYCEEKLSWLAKVARFLPEDRAQTPDARAGRGGLSTLLNVRWRKPVSWAVACRIKLVRCLCTRKHFI